MTLAVSGLPETVLKNMKEYERMLNNIKGH